MIPECTGNRDSHCCYLAGGKVCDYLEEHTVAGRRWACGLLVKYGSWEAMNQSDEYRPVGEQWVARNQPFNYCETFDPSFCCRPEYRNGRRYPGHVPVNDADRYDGRYG